MGNLIGGLLSGGGSKGSSVRRFHILPGFLICYFCLRPNTVTKSSITNVNSQMTPELATIPCFRSPSPLTP